MPLKKESSGCRNAIVVRGARANNLKNIDIDIPRNKFVVVTGLSGSGKSSLAFDTIYAEGNRRYMEGMSSYARNFLDPGAKPDVDKIENLSPPISIDQKSISRSPRSTVGTLTEVYDFLRVLYAKIGSVHCPGCGKVMQRKSAKEISQQVFDLPHHAQVAILAKVKDEKKSLMDTLKSVRQLGYARICFQGRIVTVAEAEMDQEIDISQGIDVVIDRIMIDSKRLDRERILDSVETALKVGGGSMKMLIDGKEEFSFSRDYYCQECSFKIREITPRHFSFNNPEGACVTCSGLGYVLKVNQELIVPNKKLSVAEGAIQPWSKSGGKMSSQNNNVLKLRELGRKIGFSLETPIEKMSVKALSAIMFGAGAFEGVIPSMEKKYQETRSDYLRSEIEKYMTMHICPECQGKRLKKEFLSVKVASHSIDDLVNMGISELKGFFLQFRQQESNRQKLEIADPIVREIVVRLAALENVGLDYLNLGRSAKTISGGEAQRIRLASQLNSLLMGIVYVLDEPSIGLHSRDTEKLVATMKMLQELGNSLVVVEHDESIIKAADWIIDMGPGAGEEGGTVVFEGDYGRLLQSNNLTAQYIAKKKKVSQNKKRRKGNGKSIEIIGATEHNLKNVSVSIPLQKMVALCGVSGSGKSTLMHDILSKALSRHFYGSRELPGAHKKITGLEHIKKVISINQSPIGRTPRSNAATYTGVFSHIRDLFAQTEEAKSRGYDASRFSFNMKGGRCEVCQGEGCRKIEMHLLPDMYVKCEACEGTRYGKKTLEIEYKGYTIAQVLDMDVRFAHRFFARHPLIAEKLRTMEEVGLGYLKLGQSATNLSGGEAQRIKLATELARKSMGSTLYILDEPTVGLHFDDTRKLLGILNALVNKGNSVLVVEHNLDVIRDADWVIELGPDGGTRGGLVTFEGTPDELKKDKRSWTSKYL